MLFLMWVFMVFYMWCFVLFLCVYLYLLVVLGNIAGTLPSPQGTNEERHAHGFYVGFIIYTSLF